MLVAPDRGVRCWTIRIGQTVAILAAVGLLAGCLGASSGGTSSGTPGTGGTGTPGTPGTSSGGNGYGGNGGDANGGGTGGNGGNGYGGWGGNGYGGNGGNANGVAGSGRLTSRTLSLSGVTSVLAGANFVVRLRTGGPAQATVTMDDNLTDLVDATVVGNQLRLGIKPGMTVRDAALSAEVTVGGLDRLTTSGASRVVLDHGLITPTLQLVVSGGSSVTGGVNIDQAQAMVSGAGSLALSGQVHELRFTAAGASQLPMADLTVRQLDATLSGASHATVTVTGTLAAQATGASVLRYRGNPSVTRSQTSGMSSIGQDSP